jgi:hypothetical protein
MQYGRGGWHEEDLEEDRAPVGAVRDGMGPAPSSVPACARGCCDDVLSQLDPSPSKQSYNEVIDCRLLDELRIKPGSVITLGEYLELINRRVPGIEKICTHPKEDERRRLASLTAGLVKLGVRPAAPNVHIPVYRTGLSG